jgi:hypothetical protein
LAIVIPAFLVPGGEAEIVAEDSLVALQSEIHEAQAAARAERAAQEAEQAAKVERVTPKEGPARPSADEPSCTHSFDPSTPVLMADGSHKAIKDVKVGDEVLTTDPTTGKTVIEKVTALHDNHDTDLADVTVVDASGKTTVLHTTWHHPFYNADTHTFTDAADLTPGTNLYTLNHQRLRVVSVRTWTGLHDMRDLTIANVHTYYVVGGTASVLVHNCGNRTQVDYFDRDNDLVNAVHNQRIADNNVGNNYASARYVDEVEMSGLQSIILLLGVATMPRVSFSGI